MLGNSAVSGGEAPCDKGFLVYLTEDKPAEPRTYFMATTPLPKTAPKEQKAKQRRLPPHADYSDVVTEEHSARIRNLVPDEEHKDGKIEHGPAW